mgnify:CR=1 FL=1
MESHIKSHLISLLLILTILGSGGLQLKNSVMSWYGIGDGFHGKTTANGETYNAYRFTFANNKLEFGTKVIFFYKDNIAIGYCNDRGGFGKYGRQFDLSYGIAKELGLVEVGVDNIFYKILDKKEIMYYNYK